MVEITSSTTTFRFEYCSATYKGGILTLSRTYGLMFGFSFYQCFHTSLTMDVATGHLAREIQQQNWICIALTEHELQRWHDLALLIIQMQTKVFSYYTSFN